MKKNKVLWIISWLGTICGGAIFFAEVLGAAFEAPSPYYFYYELLDKQTVIAALGLVGLVWYVYYTYRAATDPYIPLASIILEPHFELDPSSQSLVPIIRPAITNLSKVSINVAPKIEATINNKKVFIHKAYDGKHQINLLPGQTFKGKFGIIELLKKRQLNLQDMLDNKNRVNRKRQLRFKVSVKYENEKCQDLSKFYETTPIEYYYLFKRPDLILDA